MYYFTRNVQADSWNLILGVVMYIVHMLGEWNETVSWKKLTFFHKANKYWSVLFWDMNDPESAVNVLVFVMLPTSVALMVAFIINQTGIFWVPVMLLSIYIAWLIYAAALNVHWVNKRLSTTDNGDEKRRRRGRTYE